MKCVRNFDEIQDGKILTVILRGEIDHHSAVKLRGNIDDLILKKRPKILVLDLGDIDFMDSSGLGLIMGRYQKMNGMGGELVVKNPSKSALKICQLAGLGRLIKIETNV